MKKALIVTSVASMIKQFNIPNIQILQRLGYDVTVATNFEEPGTIPYVESQNLYSELLNMKVEPINIDFNRNPVNLNNLNAYKSLKKLLHEQHYDIIHCQSPVGGALTRLAAKNTRKTGTKVIYTAHGFHFYEGAPLKNWMLYYPIEKILSKYTDVLITINKEDYERSLKLHAHKNYYVPGVGVEINNNLSDEKNQLNKRKELGINSKSIVITSVGELNINKNHQVVLKSLEELKHLNFDYLICGKGEELVRLKKLVEDLGLNNKVHFLGYRKDINQILQISDIYVFPSLREGLSVSLMEAMSFGLPIVASNIRGNRDLIDHNQGGYLVNRNDKYQYKQYIFKLYESRKIREKFGRYNIKKVEYFSSDNVNKKMKKLENLI